MARVYFAFSGGNHVASANTFRSWHNKTGTVLPLLVSYYYRGAFEKALGLGMPVGDLVLDSGAFSAANSRAEIKLREYAAWAKSIPAKEIYSLDVIGDWEATKRNTEELWSLGVKAIPAFHYGSPESALEWCAEHSEKIALGGVAGRSTTGSLAVWVQQCLARVWPKRVHGFGMTRAAILRAAPLDSVDSTSWCCSLRFGRWKSMGDIPTQGAKHNYDLFADLEPYLEMERKSEAIFAADLAKIRKGTP